MTNSLELKKLIEEDAFVRVPDRPDFKWIFDFRRITLTPIFLSLYTKIFFEIFKDEKDFQVCGLESASITLISGIVLESQKRGLNINGFFLRKSAKKHDLFKVIEGIPNNLPVVIVDDILNSGSSTLKQIKILKENNIQIKTVFTILRFRNIEFYDFLKKEGIEVISLFELNDFKDKLNVENLKNSKENLQPLPHKVIWGLKYGTTNWKAVIPKSSPIIHKDKIYFGTDSGIFYCVNKFDGKIIWARKIWFGADGKMIFSTPTIYNNTVFFGAYDGNFYALDCDTGEKKWIYSDADWIGSSPSISVKNNLVYIGLEYGLWNKQGGIVGLNIQTGVEVWKDIHSGLTHCSPFVSEKNNLLFCGSNDGILRIYNSKTGEKLKEHNIGLEMRSSFSESDKGDKVAFGAFDGYLYIVNTKTLELEDKFKTFEAIYTTPVWSGEKVIFAALDKRVYCYDTIKKEKVWENHTNGRIFASPVIHKTSVWIGCNDGKLRKINLETGVNEGYIQFTERIVDRVIFNEDKLYVKSFANQIYCITLPADVT